jgi:hypothetical protein
MKKMNFNYLYFDIYSKRASFYFNNQDKIGSNCGLFLTILYILTSLLILIFYFIQTFERRDIKLYNSNIYAQEMPIINIDSNNLYFAFGLEDPITLNRYIDESIYYPQILYLDRIKINGEFKTIKKDILEYERCKEKNFGRNYQHFFSKGDLNNSYCLKDFNYNLTFAGGHKYERMAYIRLKIFPCVNTTENKNHCKSQEEIDYYLTSAYFSILIKDFGLNPSDYKYPIIPTLQDQFTTIGRSFLRTFYINFGITEVHTDTSFFNEKINIEKYPQYRNTYQFFFFREQQEYLDGKEMCIVHIQLDDTIHIQKRTYLKLTEILSKMGGYMQLIYTIFSILSLVINKFDSELKIINSIFNFNLKEKKMGLKFKSLDFDSISMLSSNKNLIFSPKKSLKNISQIDFRFNNKNEKELDKNDSSYVSSVLNISDNKKIINESFNKINLNPLLKINRYMYKQKKFKTINSNNFIPKINISLDAPKNVIRNVELKDHISLNLFDYIFRRKNNIKKRHIDLYRSGFSFYKKRMDIVHVFTLLLITEKVLIKSHGQQIIYLLKESEMMQHKN